MPVARTTVPEIHSPEEPKQAVPAASLSKVASAHQSASADNLDRGALLMREHQESSYDGRSVAAATVGAGVVGAGIGAAAATSSGGAPASGDKGIRAVVQYDYEIAEPNEIELVEGQYVTNIEMVDEDWWHGTNAKGESGLFPSNYVEVVEDDAPAAPTPAAAAPVATQGPPSPPPAAAAPAGAGQGKTATAQYEYDAAEENELSFPDGATITNVVCFNSISENEIRTNSTIGVSR